MKVPEMGPFDAPRIVDDRFGRFERGERIEGPDYASSNFGIDVL